MYIRATICIWTLPCMEKHVFRLNMSDFLRGWRDYVKRGWGDYCAINSRLLEYVKGQLTGLSYRQAQERAAWSCYCYTVIPCGALASALFFPPPKLVAKYRTNKGRENNFKPLNEIMWHHCPSEQPLSSARGSRGPSVLCSYKQCQTSTWWLLVLILSCWILKSLSASQSAVPIGKCHFESQQHCLYLCV